MVKRSKPWGLHVSRQVPPLLAAWRVHTVLVVLAQPEEARVC